MFDGLDFKNTQKPAAPALDLNPKGPAPLPPTIFKQMGSMIFPTSAVNSPSMPLLPGKAYVVKVHPEMGFYLDEISPFELPKKVYGDVTKNVSRVVTTFRSRSGNTGILLSGDKGGGKSMFAKMVCRLMADLDCPTIVVNEPFCGTPFNDFLAKITQECVVLIDEFEKTYHKMENQQAMLTLLDGVVMGKKLFILTCNDPYAVNHHMKNRPGRIFYRMDYSGLDMAFIKEYCQDALIDKTRVLEICAAMVPFGDQLNFDMLKAVVEEVNRYPGSVHEHLKILNVRSSDAEGEESYSIRIMYNGLVLGAPLTTVLRSTLTPMKYPIEFYLYFSEALKVARTGQVEVKPEPGNPYGGNGQQSARLQDAQSSVNRRLKARGLSRPDFADPDDEFSQPDEIEISEDGESMKAELLVFRDNHKDATAEELLQTDVSRKGKATLPKMTVKQLAFCMNILDHEEFPGLDDDGDVCMVWNPDQLVSSSMSKGHFEFKNEYGVTLRIEKESKPVPWASKASAYSGLGD